MVKTYPIKLFGSKEVLEEALQIYLQSFNQEASHEDKLTDADYQEAKDTKNLYDKVDKAKAEIKVTNKEATKLMYCVDIAYHNALRQDALSELYILDIKKVLKKVIIAFYKTSPDDKQKKLDKINKNKHFKIN